MRRALVASVLVTAGCDQGAKPARAPDREEQPSGGGGNLDQVAPQVAYSNGFTLELVDEKEQPIAGVAVKVTLERGETLQATTSARGDAYLTTRIDAHERATVEAEGYERVVNEYVEGGMSPVLRVVLKKKCAELPR